MQREDVETWESFLRRMHKVVVYDKVGKITEYSYVKEYFDNAFIEIEDNGDLPF